MHFIATRLIGCTKGAAAAEMALVTPMLLALLFGSVELGHYFWREHTVVKAVRDGARFAARQPMGEYFTTSSGCVATTDTTLTGEIANVVLTGTPEDDGTPRIPGWTDASTIQIAVECKDEADEEEVTGIYKGMSYAGAAVGAPVITITATVPYQSLFGLNFVSDYGLNAQQEAAVVGF